MSKLKTHLLLCRQAKVLERCCKTQHRTFDIEISAGPTEHIVAYVRTTGKYRSSLKQKIFHAAIVILRTQQA